MRIVLDTNVLVSGIFSRGIPSSIVLAWLANRFSVFATPSILDEYLRVVDRLKQSKSPALDHDWPVVFQELCHVITEVHFSRALCRDPADIKFLACALSANANYIVSGDADLLVLDTQFPFRIVTPRHFLALL